MDPRNEITEGKSVTTYHRILKFSPDLTYGVALDGNFYPFIRPLTGLSAQVIIDHSPIEIGHQIRLYETCYRAYILLAELSRDLAFDDTCYEAIKEINVRTDGIKSKCLGMLRNHPRLAEAGREWSAEYLSAMGPYEAGVIVNNWKELELPNDVLARHFASCAILFTDDALCILQRRPDQALDSAILAKHCLGLAFHFSGLNTIGGPMPSTKGGQAKRDRSKRMGDFAFDLAQDGTYRSKAEAVRRIKERVIKHARETEGWTMSALQADDTITTWLSTRGYIPRAS